MPKLPTGLLRKKGRPGYYARDQRGGRDRLVKLSNDRDVAIRKLRAMRGEAPTGPVTVKQAVDRWLRGPVATRRSPGFAELTKNRAEDYLFPLYGARQLSSMTAERCEEYRVRLEGHGIAMQTVAHILSDLRCMLRWAAGPDVNLIARSPFPARLVPWISEAPPDRLEDEEVEKLIAMPEPWGFYLRLLLATGIRWGEAVRAEASHVERGHLVLAGTKSGRVRRVPLSPSILGELRGRVGKLLHVTKAQTLAKVARRLSGVARFHVHMTRHTYACRWLEAGGSIEALSVALGHTRITTTQRYGRPNEDAVRREARKGWG